MQESIYQPVWVQLLVDATATNGAPTLATDGVDIQKVLGTVAHLGRSSIMRIGHAATGARTCTLKVWGYGSDVIDSSGSMVSSSAEWIDTEEQFVLASTSTDGVIAQVFEYLTVFERIYIEVVAITGTSNTVNVTLGLTPGS